MPRALKAASPLESKPRRVAAERKRTPVSRKAKPAPAPVAEFDPSAHHDEIAHAAYLKWIERGYVIGSPEQDWFEAEQSVRAKYAA